MTRTARSLQRRLERLTSREDASAEVLVRRVCAELSSGLPEIRRRAEGDAAGALREALHLHVLLPALFERLDDRFGLLGGAMENATRLMVDLLHETAGDAGCAAERYRVYQALFDLWVEDDTGFLQGLSEALLDCVTDATDEATLLEIAHRYLRDAPLVFPAPRGKKLDLQRSLLEADRYKVERMVGELCARSGRHEHAVLSARTHFMLTGDPVDYVRNLARSGLEREACDVARRALRRAAVPRRAELLRILEGLEARRVEDGSRAERLAQELREVPDREGFRRLRELLPPSRWRDELTAILAHLQAHRRAASLVFELYLEEGMVLEADGLVVTQPVEPHVLAAGAEAILAEHPDRAAGWFLIASHEIMKAGPERANYDQAASWLGVVRTAAGVTGQQQAFDRAIAAFKERYGRRRVLLQILRERGL